MKRYGIIVLMCVVTLFFVLSISATAADKPHYVVGKAGAFFPTSDLEDDDFETGFNGEIAYGYRFHPNIAIEGGIGYIQTNADTDFGFIDADADLTIVPVTATIKGIYSFDSIEIFGGAGLGAYFATLELDVDFFGDEDDSDTVFGGQLVAGANYNINPTLFVGVEGKYFITSEAEFDLDYGFFGSIEAEGELSGFTVTGNVGFRF